MYLIDFQPPSNCLLILAMGSVLSKHSLPCLAPKTRSNQTLLDWERFVFRLHYLARERLYLNGLTRDLEEAALAHDRSHANNVSDNSSDLDRLVCPLCGQVLTRSNVFMHNCVWPTSVSDRVWKQMRHCQYVLVLALALALALGLVQENAFFEFPISSGQWQVTARTVWQ